MNKSQKHALNFALEIMQNQAKDDDKIADGFPNGTADRDYYHGRASGHRICAATLENVITCCEKIDRDSLTKSR